MKKFIIGASAIVFAVIATIVALACVPKKYDLNFSQATSLQVYAKYGVAKKHGDEDSFDSSSAVYKSIMNLLKKSMSNSLLSLLAHGANTNPVVEQDLSGMSPTFSWSSTPELNYCISMQFDEPQNQIVYYQGNSKYLVTDTAGFYDLMFVLGAEKGYNKVYVYYTTSSGGTYKTNPIVISIDNSKLIDYIDKM